MTKEASKARMTIGVLAKTAGVGVETVRYYQRRGLLDEPRAQDGYRTYGPSHIERLRFIRRAQSAGFSLEDIAELLRLNDTRDHLLARQLAEHKLADIATRIAHLEAMAAALRHLLGACHHGGEHMPCPIIRMSLDGAPGTA